MQTRGGSPFIAGELSLADLYLAPIASYVAMTPDKDAVFGVEGFATGGARIAGAGELPLDRARSRLSGERSGSQTNRRRRDRRLALRHLERF